MRGTLLIILIIALSFTASCVRAPLLADAGDVIPRATATDESPSTSLIHMPPLYVDASHIYAQKIKKASVDATVLCARKLNCPAVRVRRADSYVREDGTTWTVVRLNACGQERVYEETLLGWSDATSRLR